MRPAFELLDHAETPMGAISLRRRREPSRGVDVFEVKLGDEFLMSSLFTVAEEELARLGLDAATGDRLDVVVGGLGLGYTANVARQDPRVRSLTVVEALPQVVDWHERDLLPDVAGLAADPRTELLRDDFFARVARGDLVADVVMLDIDHSPRHVLHDSHANFYTVDGLRRLADGLRPGGVFALWSDDPPDEAFLADARQVFAVVDAHVVPFPNFLTGGESANTVYVAR